jgi:hypothetical protein
MVDEKMLGIRSDPLEGPRRAPTLHDILRLEDDPAILRYKCDQTGILWWPLIRVSILRMLMSDMLYGVPLSGPAVARASPLSTLRTLGRTTLHNVRHRAIGVHRDIVVMPSGAGNVLIGGKWFNRLGDYFVQERQHDTLVIEEMLGTCWPFPRHGNDLLFHQPFRLKTMLAERVLARISPSQRAAELIELAMRRGRDIIGWDCGDERAEWLTRLLQRRVAGLPLLFGSYKKLFRRIRPKVIILEEACYGGHFAALIAAARELDIVTAEYQHGAVSAGHDAYNVAPALVASAEYRLSLPEYFLSYGDWWNEQINVPLAKLSIGNPHRTEHGTRGSRSPSVCNILVLGDGVETALYLELAKSIAQADKGSRVVFRPHPMERDRVRDLAAGGSSALSGVVIDTSADIYESFRRARALVSEVSTGLFEAVGLVERIFIWDTMKARFAYPSHSFEDFTSVEELVRKLARPCTPLADQLDTIWAPHWRENYRHFLDSILSR